MIESLKNWLPMTKRNRVALGFAVAALVLFVAWNFLPLQHYYGSSSEIMAFEEVWGWVFSSDPYLEAVKSPNFDDFRAVCAFLALMLHAVTVLLGIPFWKLLHSSNYLKVPLALVNLIGGSVLLSFFFEGWMDDLALSYMNLFLSMSLSMLLLSAALFIFKNELGLRNDLEMKKMMANGDAR